jgi:hypothetical protein
MYSSFGGFVTGDKTWVGEAKQLFGQKVRVSLGAGVLLSIQGVRVEFNICKPYRYFDDDVTRDWQIGVSGFY